MNDHFNEIPLSTKDTKICRSRAIVSISLRGHWSYPRKMDTRRHEELKKEEEKGSRCTRFWKALTIEGVLEEENSPSERIMIGEAAERSGAERREAGRVAHKRIIKRPA